MNVLDKVVRVWRKSNPDLSKVVFEGVDLTGANFEFSKLMKMERDVHTKLDHKWDLVWELASADLLRDKITAQPEKISEAIHLLLRSESSRGFLKEFGVLSRTIPSGFR